jgi:hypothetical protein
MAGSLVSGSDKCRRPPHSDRISILSRGTALVLHHREYVECFNRVRLHLGIGQKIPERSPSFPEREGKERSSHYHFSTDCTITGVRLYLSKATETRGGPPCSPSVRAGRPRKTNCVQSPVRIPVDSRDNMPYISAVKKSACNRCWRNTRCCIHSGRDLTCFR